MKTVPLGEVARIISGATPKTNISEYWGGGLPWATPADLSKLKGPYLEDTPRHLTEAGLKSCAATVLPAGSVLLSSRAPIGHVAINRVPMATNQGFKSLIPNPELDAKYAYYWLRCNTSMLQGMGNGATFKEISKSVVERINIPLPGIEEQRRIAAILDQADAIRNKRHQALAHLDSLPLALFHDRFGDPHDWGGPTVTIGDLAECVDYGTSAKSGDSGEWPILRMGNITDDGRIILDDLKHADLSPEDARKYSVCRGDLLFNRTNSVEKVGKAAVVHSDDRLAIAGYLVRVRFNEVGLSDFISTYLQSPHGRGVRRSLAKAAVNQANISASQMKTIRVQAPDKTALWVFARDLEAIRGERSRLERQLAADDELFASLQARAFRGDL